MPKVHYILTLILVLLALSACHTLWKAQTPIIIEAASVITLPTTDVPLPVTDFTFLLPSSPQLDQTTSPRKNITEDFSSKEKNDIAVVDPKLMSDNNSLIIDLGHIQKEDYVFPLPGAKIISPYGGRRRHHTGIDLKTHAKDTIVSAFDGIVRIAKPYFAYGNVIVIRHYNGLETVYSHNSKNLAKPGDRVKAGQPIALTGRTGRATTEHLHFEIRVNGQHFNPNLIFNLTNMKLNDQCLVFTKNGNKVTVKEINIMPHQQAGDYTYSPNSPKSNIDKESKDTL